MNAEATLRTRSPHSIAFFSLLSLCLLSPPTCVLFGDGSVTQDDAELSLPAREGYIEAFTMGTAIDPDLFRAINESDCGAVRETWVEGAWRDDPNALLEPPRSELRASASLINVERGPGLSHPAG